MAANGIIGDQGFATEFPEMQVDEAQLTAEKNAAKFSRSREFQALKAYLVSRIEYYQKYLPDGRNILAEGVGAVSGEDWRLANAIVGELQAVIDSYENANKAITDAARPQTPSSI